MSEIVERLEAHEGRNPGEAIATYGRSIVFLPKGVKPGSSVRVKLEEIREDSRGRMMYRGVPASVDYTERWKNNDDGTISRVTISTNWLLEEREEGTIETRQASEREVVYTTRTDSRIVWGQDQASSSVEQTKVTVYHTQREQAAYNGTLDWVKTAEREQKDAPVLVAITKVVCGYGDLSVRKLELAYQAAWTLSADAYYMSGSYETYVRENTTWGALPVWLQSQLQANYVICVCGRSRCETQSDGYGKCEKCRAEEVCVRCGKQTKVANLNGRLVCNDCKPYEEQEQLVARCVTIEKREELAKIAETLLTAEALPEDAAMVILGVTLGHVESEWYRTHWLEEWKGYAFYYFTDQGVYGTKFSAAALAILKFLPYAVGNQLVELIAWVAGRMKEQDWEYYGDFYHSTQVKGESRKPSLTESALADLNIAMRLRGSEADRQAVMAWLSSGDKPGDDYGSRPGPRLEAIREEVKKLMQASEQDYAKALALIAEFEQNEATRHVRAEAGEIWPDAKVDVSTRSRTATYVWCFAPDGSEVKGSEVRYQYKRHNDLLAYDFGDLSTDHLVLCATNDNYGYRYSEDWIVCYLPKVITPEQERAARAVEPHGYFVGTGTGWDLTQQGTVAFTTQYHRDLVPGSEEYNAHERMVSQNPINVDEWDTQPAEEDEPHTGVGTWVVWARPRRSNDPAMRKWQKAIEQAEAEVADAASELAHLEQAQQHIDGDYDQAEQRFLERELTNAGTRPIDSSSVFEVSGFERRESPSGERFEYGPFFDAPSGTNVYLVLDPFSNASGFVREGERVLVTARPRSSAQFYLFKGRKYDSAARRDVFVTGYFVTAILAPSAFDSQIEEATGKLEAAQTHLADLKVKPPKMSAPKNGNHIVATFNSEASDEPVTAMEAALRKAFQGKE